MDLFLLSYRIQQRRYHVPPELVAEAILLWHRGLTGTRGPDANSMPRAVHARAGAHARAG